MNRSKMRSLCIFLILMNTAFIWGNSLLPGSVSGAISDEVMQMCKDVLEPILSIFGEETVPPPGNGMLLLRKSAHFLEYLLLGLNWCWLFLVLGQRGIHRFTMPMLPAVLTAMADETIQLFVPGRASSLVDVWIDTAGLTLGILLILGGTIIQKKTSNENLEDKKR